MKASLLNALRPLDEALWRYLVKTGQALPAFYEEVRVRNLIRTDSGQPYLVTNIPIGPVAYGSLGTSAVHVAGTLYYSEIYIPRAFMVTGIGFLNGGTVGTDNLLVALYDATGKLLANSAVAGALSAGANAFQEIAFTLPYTLQNDGRHYIAIQCNGTTATTRRIAASTYLNRAGSSTGTFGTVPKTITPPTTITATAGPIGYVY